MATEDSVAQDQIKAFVDRILRLKGEVKEINADVREIYAEAKGNGFDKTVLGKLVSYVEKRQENSAAVMESESIFDLYLTAYDSAKGKAGTVRATHTHASEDAEDDSASVNKRIAALKANPALAIVGAADLKKSEQPSNLQKVQNASTEPQPAPQAGSDLTAHAPQGQVAPIQPETANEKVGGFPVAAAPRHAEETGAALIPSVKKDHANVSVTGVTGGESAATKYPEPGIVVWEDHPPEGVERHEYSMAFGTLGQDIAVIEDDLVGAKAEPIVKMGKVILDGWARYMKARELGIEYPVIQYGGDDPMGDCIRWNLAGRILNDDQKRVIAQRMVKLYPQRKGPIFAEFGLGMELA